MGSIIRPRFGGIPSDGGRNDAPVRFKFVRGIGQAGGYRVTLIRDYGAPEGDVYKVVVDEGEGGFVEPVASVPATPFGEHDAGVIGLAILRTLEAIEANSGSLFG